MNGIIRLMLRMGGTNFANYQKVMNTIDLFIIYLAFGAPCGVYFFFQNRNKTNPKKLLLKSLLTVFVWIPYAFKLLHDFITTKFRTSRFNVEFSTSQRIHKIQNQLSKLLVDSCLNVSLFEFREILERYAGLSLACNSKDKNPGNSEREIFRVSLHPSIELGANCLHRRNRFRLKFHQSLASNDFLQIINKLHSSGFDLENLRRLAFEFVKILNDPDAEKSLAGIFNKTLQSAGSFSVKELESEVWKSREHKQSSPRRATMHS